MEFLLHVVAPNDPIKPSTGIAVRVHRNAVRDRSERPSAIDRNHCPFSPESAVKENSEAPRSWHATHVAWPRESERRCIEAHSAQPSAGTFSSPIVCLLLISEWTIHDDDA